MLLETLQIDEHGVADYLSVGDTNCLLSFCVIERLVVSST